MTHPYSTSGLLHKATRSIKWSVLTEIVARTVPPLVFVVLAKLLSPEDYGVVGTAMISVAFCQMFWDAGLSKALVQTNDSPLEAAHVVFWTNLVLGLIIYLILYAAAPWIAIFFHSPKSSPVLRVLGLQVIVASLTSVQQALLVRDMGFKRLFWVKLVTAFMPGMVSIPLAIYGRGVWALVAGTLAGQTINLFLLWKLSSWKPRWQYDTVLARKLFGFGVWVVLESLGAWLIVWGDNVIVGRYLGVHDLGVYRTGLMMVTLVFGLILNPIVPVVYPTFSRLQDDAPSLRTIFNKVNRLVIAFSLPIGAGLFLVGPELAALIFGEKWQGLGQVVGILGLMHGVAWLVGLNAELYRAMGRPDVNTKLMFAQLSFYLPAFYLAAQHGLSSFVYTRLGVAVAATALHVFLCVKMLKVSPFYLWHEGKAMFLSGLIMVAVVLSAKAIHGWQFHHAADWFGLVMLALVGVASYAGTLWVLDRKFILGLGGMLKKAAWL